MKPTVVDVLNFVKGHVFDIRLQVFQINNLQQGLHLQQLEFYV